MALRGSASPRRRLVAAVLLFGLAGPACRSSGYVYIQSADSKAYFKVPSNWKMFGKRAMLIGSGTSQSAATDRQFKFLVGFDSNPTPSVTNVLDLTKPLEYPAIQARQQELPSTSRDQISLQGLRNSVFDLDQLVNNNIADIVSYNEVILPGGLYGNHTVYDVALNGLSGIETGNSVIRFDQTAILDSGNKTMYLFVVRCESHCWKANATLLSQIVSSWTVKDR